MKGPGQLLLAIVALVATIVGGLVATAETRAWWTLALTIGALVAAGTAVAICVHALLSQDDRGAPTVPARGPVVALATVATVAVALAVALPVEDSAAVSTATPDAAAAAATVRAFLASAVLDGNAYAACQYLAPDAQQQLARLAGDGQTCRDALTATDPSLAGVHSEGSLRGLHLRAAVRGGQAFVTAPGRVTFVLRPATAAEARAFAAPHAAWRIVAGATAVLPGERQRANSL